MPAKLIVTGLGDCRGEDLYDLFDVYGLIVDVGVERRPSDEGMGYVVFEDGVCAVRARLGMDGAEVNGRRIGVLPVVPVGAGPGPRAPEPTGERVDGPWFVPRK